MFGAEALIDAVQLCRFPFKKRWARSICATKACRVIAQRLRSMMGVVRVAACRGRFGVALLSWCKSNCREGGHRVFDTQIEQTQRDGAEPRPVSVGRSL